MSQRTTTPLSGRERQQRYIANHPEKKEQSRMRMAQLRAERRQKRDAERLGVIAPDEFGLDPEAHAALMALIKRPKIITGLAQDDIPNKTANPPADSPTQGSKV